MASVKLEIKGARSVVVIILDNGSSDRGSIPHAMRFFFKISTRNKQLTGFPQTLEDPGNLENTAFWGKPGNTP